MKKYPYIHQENSNDCGIACLEMVIRYYKGYVPTSLLITMTHTDQKGTSAYHMIETLKHFGFQATGVSCDLKEDQKIIFPCIAHVTLDEKYLHYVVIYEIDWKKKMILIADPAQEMKRMRLDVFEQIYNHVLIILYPIQKIPVYQRPYSFITYTLKTVQKHWKLFLPICIISIFILILSFIGTFYLSIFLHFSSNFWISFLIFFVVLEIAKHFISYFRSILLQQLNEKLSTYLTFDAFSKIMKLPYLYYHNLPTGDFMARMQDVKLIQEVISTISFTVLFDGILFIFSLLFLVCLEPYLFPICICLVIAYGLLVRYFRPFYKRNILSLEKQNVSVQSYMLDYMRGFEMVKGLSITNQVISHFQNRYQNYANCFLRFQKQVVKENMIRSILESLGYLGFMAVGLFLYHRGSISIGMIFAYQLLFSYIMGPIVQIVDSDFLVQRAKSALQRICNLAIEEKVHHGKEKTIQSIGCRHLCYGIQENKPILVDVNLEWKQGQKIMIMGPSGSGKSTLLQCIKGYYPIDETQIFINHECISYYDSSYLQSQILYISQNETLILGSVYENVTMLDTYEPCVVEAVMKLCEIDVIVKEHPLGYQMPVEENGSNLSGGERAQIVLARTLLKPFQVLLIDEGFGQMDVNLERRILKKLFENYSDRMIAVISHRRDNMDFYHQVLHLEKGRIVKVLERST